MKIKIKNDYYVDVCVLDTKGISIVEWRGALISFFIDNKRDKSLYINSDRMFINYGLNKFKTISF
jgi:hypothetical protein